MNKAVIILLLLLLPSFSLSTETVKSVNKIPVGAYYYLWYGYNSTSNTWTGGNRTSHWNDSKFGIVLDNPSLGYYSSIDNNTLKNHLYYMQYCGIDFVIVSWWGWGVTDFSKPNVIDTLNRAIDNATLNLFKYLKATKSTMKVALLVENFSGPIDFTQTYNYILTKYYNPYNAWIFKWDSKPLLLSFNPLTLQANDSFTTRMVGNPPNNYDWNFWRGMEELDNYSKNFDIIFYKGNPEISSDEVVGVVPRFDDKALNLSGARNTFMQFDRTLTKGLYSKEWQYLRSRKDNISMVLIYSWNENHERSAIEPLTYYGDPGRNRTYLVEMTKKEISSFESYVPPANESLTLPNLEILISIAIALITAFLIASNKRKQILRLMQTT